MNISETKADNMYKEKLFTIMLPTMYFKIIEIDKKSLIYIITNDSTNNFFFYLNMKIMSLSLQVANGIIQPLAT